MSRVKYPRTPHLPWSPGATSDDAQLPDVTHFEGHEVVVTEKLDGENTTLYRDGTHARSLDSGHHPSRTWVKALHARIRTSIPEGFRICGENLAARHSIAYADLDGFFYAFSVWSGDTALSWNDTVRFAHDRGLPTPRVLFRGPFDRKALRRFKVPPDSEGYVVRRVDGFERSDFAQSLAKWVRPNHVQTDTHWMHAQMVPNALRRDAALWDIRSGGPVGDLAWLGGEDSDVNLPVLGDRRLAAVLAGRFRNRFRSELLPELVTDLGHPLGRRVADLVGLAGLLNETVPEDARSGGLITLARAVDLAALHALAEDTETVRWSRLVAEDLGLLEPHPFEAYAHLHPYRRHIALEALSAGRIRSIEEAEALTHGKEPTGALEVLVGPSGSGKSTLVAGRPNVIELDGLRGRYDDALTEGLHRLRKARGTGIWDATSLTRPQRDLPLAVAREFGVQVTLTCVLTPRPIAEARNARRARRVPDNVVDRQWRRTRWPYPFEAAIVRYTRDGTVIGEA